MKQAHHNIFGNSRHPGAAEHIGRFHWNSGRLPQRPRALHANVQKLDLKPLKPAARFIRCEPLEARPSQHDWLLIHGAGRLRNQLPRVSECGRCNGNQWGDGWIWEIVWNCGNISCFFIEQSRAPDVSWKKHLPRSFKITSTLELAMCNPGIFCWPPSRSSRSATRSRNPPALGMRNRSWQVKAMHPKLKTWVTMSRPLEKHTLGKTNMQIQIIFLWSPPLHKCPVPRRPRIEWAGSRIEVHSAPFHHSLLWPYKTCLRDMQLHAFI